MRQALSMAVLSAMVLWLTGCPSDSAPGPSPKTDVPVRNLLPPPAAAPPLAPATPPSSPPSPPSSSSPTGQQSIALSTGVALPQTGPEGTMMMFSVDYEVQDEPSSSGYVWVIERAHGKPARIDRKLKKKGTLEAAMVTGWRPEDGPFHSHLEDRNGERVSESIEMLQTGG